MGIKAPYKLYPVQKEIMKDLNIWWKSDKKHILLQAPTGSGKTILHLLFALLKLKRGHRIIYFSREHAQIQQCTYELSQLITLNPSIRVKAVHIAGKSHSCLHNSVREISDTDAQSIACEDVTSAICGYVKYIRPKPENNSIYTLLPEFKNMFYSFDILTVGDRGRVVDPNMVTTTAITDITNDLFSDGIASNEKIMEVAEKYFICPRILQKWAMVDANIIFAPYNYMVIPRYETHPDNDIYIIDESHNLDSNLVSMYSVKISMRTFSSYFRYIQKNMKFSYLTPLNTKVIQKVVKYKDDDYELNGRELDVLLKSIDENDITDLLDLFDEMISNSTRARKYGGKEKDDLKIPKSFLSMKKFLDSLLRMHKNYRSGFITVEDEFMNLNFVDTDIIFNKISAKAKKIIISSGSLYPKYMASYLGLKKSDSLIFEYNPPHKNRFNIASVIKSYNGTVINSKWSNRTDNVMISYAKIIRDVYLDNPKGTLVYFTSYAYRNKIEEYLEEWNIFPHRPETVDIFKEEIANGERAIFMSAFRGLGSEGWNLGDDLSRAIILVGIPYLPIKSMNIKAQQIYYNTRRKALGVSWYNQKAALWLMQAFGRGIRHKDDWTKVYFADSRIRQIKPYFIKWVKEATNWKAKEWKNERRKIRN